ncbi:MAG: TlpA disulfide reductase family protein [Litorilinea sp.]
MGTPVLLLLALLLLVGCNRGASNSSVATPVESTITYANLPTGLGRGYPILSFEGLDEGVQGLVPGQPAPNFRMVLDDGNSLTLEDLHGSPILINFWATWCGPCRIEMPDIVRHSNEEEDLIVLAVNVQEELEDIQGFATDFQMEMPVLRDTEGDLRRIYDLRGMPTSIFIDRAGNVTAVWPGVLTPSQIEELLADIL